MLAQHEGNTRLPVPAAAASPFVKMGARGLVLLALACLCGALAPAHAATAGEQSFYAATFSRKPMADALTRIGRTLFFDPALSASGKMSCASCHDPAHAFGPPNALPVQSGGAAMSSAGLRAVPSLRYLRDSPPFSEHYIEPDGDGTDQGPTGGLTWDGRVDRLHQQARLPLLSPFEMANASIADVAARVARGPAAASMKESFGADVFDQAASAEKALLMALEVFMQSPAEFYPYDSKYDAYLRGRAELSPAETRGLALFVGPRKGNCASCHPTGVQSGAFPPFTDYGYVAVGVPRNKAIPANADRAYYDLGLCGPLRTDLSARREFCGAFRAPSLRNTALRRSYFHNGAFHDLRQVLDFYATRDTNPEKWYPRAADGSIDKFDDLPPELRHNVNMEPPFGGHAGDKPQMDAAEIDDLMAFLDTLNDGYKAVAK